MQTFKRHDGLWEIKNVMFAYGWDHNKVSFYRVSAYGTNPLAEGQLCYFLHRYFYYHSVYLFELVFFPTTYTQCESNFRHFCGPSFASVQSIHISKHFFENNSLVINSLKCNALIFLTSVLIRKEEKKMVWDVKNRGLYEPNKIETKSQHKGFNIDYSQNKQFVTRSPLLQADSYENGTIKDLLSSPFFQWRITQQANTIYMYTVHVVTLKSHLHARWFCAILLYSSCNFKLHMESSCNYSAISHHNIAWVFMMLKIWYNSFD